jgi:hypothetical protein
MTVTQRQSLLMVAMIVMGLVFAVSIFTVARSQSNTITTRGPYMIAAGDKMMVWRIDQSTGAISYCMRDSVSTDPKFITQRAPYCSTWGQ